MQDKQMLRDRVELLYSNSRPGLLITVIASAGLVFGFSGEASQPQKLIWFGLMMCAVGIRVLDLLRWQRLQTPNPEQGLFNFRFGAIATAVLWAGYCLYFYSTFDIYELASTIIIVSAMAGGAATVLSGDKLTAIAYTQVLLLPYSMQLFIAEQRDIQILGALGFGFAIIMFSVSLRAAQFTLDSLSLRYERDNLLKNMEREVKQRTNEIVELSRLDPLTRLLNRNAFISEFKLCLEQDTEAQYAVVFIDLDGFKPVNDKFGHSTGDEVLETIATRLQVLCDAQTLLCRWGGDEFILLCPVASRDDIDRVAQDIIAKIAQPITTNKHLIKLGASIGVALYPEHGKNISDLVTLADLSMYSRKKDRSQAYVVYDQTLENKLKTELKLSKALDKAIDKAQLRLVFQPIMDAKSESIVAAEALLRWNLDGEAIPPDVFIPIAEQSGAIREIGHWVLDQSMRFAKELERQGFNLKICVNVSIAQFEDPAFVDAVQALIVEHGVNPQLIYLELTESVFSRDKLTLVNAVKGLQALGLHVSIDDFGTGYSSLSIIQDLHVNIVKVDRSFVNNLEENGLAVVRAVMVMAQGMGYKVVAEGVEKAGQAELLRELGVDLLQGYLYSKPLECDDLIESLTDLDKAAV